MRKLTHLYVIKQNEKHPFILSFAYLLKKVDFDGIVDHLALTYIIKSKAEPTTTRINRLLDVLSSYSFNLYKRKGYVTQRFFV